MWYNKFNIIYQYMVQGNLWFLCPFSSAFLDSWAENPFFGNFLDLEQGDLYRREQGKEDNYFVMVENTSNFLTVSRSSSSLFWLEKKRRQIRLHQLTWTHSHLFWVLVYFALSFIYLLYLESYWELPTLSEIKDKSLMWISFHPLLVSFFSSSSEAELWLSLH